jgi:hypothetical protein
MSAITVRERLAMTRKRYAAKTAQMEAAGAAGLGGAAVAFIEGKVPATIAKMPTKLVAGLALSYFGSKNAGTAGKIARSLGHASLAVYGYNATKNRAFIAGQSEVSGDEL